MPNDNSAVPQEDDKHISKALTGGIAIVSLALLFAANQAFHFMSSEQLPSPPQGKIAPVKPLVPTAAIKYDSLKVK
jgi:hypothetical protein